LKFDAPITRRTYSDRTVDDSWKAWCEAELAPAGKDVVDVGCGGGIYSLGFSALNARSVTGIDSSAQYLEEARDAAAHRSAGDRPNVTFHKGTASATGLPGACADLVFERALIHHLTEQQQRENARETLRILRKTGRLAVQDRTFEDVLAADDEFWVRGTLFEVFPRLLQMERARRPDADRYANLLREAGFEQVGVEPYSEVRRRYASFAELRADVLARKGRSVLFELTDSELRLYCDRLEEKARTRPLVERDAWTVWLAKPTLTSAATVASSTDTEA
jgi:ubiquinone/menaquinone biosynthesis C-methylase UbiE